MQPEAMLCFEGFVTVLNLSVCVHLHLPNASYLHSLRAVQSHYNNIGKYRKLQQK